ncbi:MAG: hypothetical protein JXA22_07310 [Candidatus Thermoplasmatota archaeon]|nr:hypothetical protein [Candidatus Thermoplasmatota archaeon]
MEGSTLPGLVKRAFYFFLPVVSVIVLAGILSFFATLSDTQVEAAVFTTEEGAGAGEQATASLGNMLLFVIPAILGSFLIVAVIRMGKKRLLKNFFRAALSVATGIILAFFLFKLIEALFQRVWYVLHVTQPFEMEIYTVHDLYNGGTYLMFLIAGLLFGYAAGSIVLSRGFTRKERNYALITISAFMGAFMAVILPTWTVIFLLLALAIWDIYAVFKGPIKDMVEMDMQGNLMARFDPLGDDSQDFPFDHLTYDAGSWQLGIGDLVFYSVLGAHSLYYSTIYIADHGWWMMPFFFIPVLIAILIGFAYTIYRLTRAEGSGILPGLPIPMFLGVGVFILMMVIAKWAI